MALRKFEVIGPIPIRDAVTKESVKTGGVVTLDDAEVVRERGKPLAATDIASLVATGCIKPVDVPKKAPKAEV